MIDPKSLGYSVIALKKDGKKRRRIIRGENIELYINYFKERIRYINPGEKFKVSDILYDIWNELSDGLKRDIGKRICKDVEKNNILGIKVYHKKNNGVIYVMKKNIKIRLIPISK